MRRSAHGSGAACSRACRWRRTCGSTTSPREHELAGGAIINAVRHAAVTALRRGREQVGQADLLGGIASEARKEGRTP